MPKLVVSNLVLAIVLLTQTSLPGQNGPEMPGPEKEHEWLASLAGDWEAEGEVHVDADKPPLKTKGTEHARMVGKLWLLAEGHGQFMEMPVSSVLTVGYDPQKKKYIGTWIDSMTAYLWTYEGSLDEERQALTLISEGPCPMRPGEMSKFKEVIELKNKNLKVFTSSMQEENGEWTKLVTVRYHRQK